MDDFKMQPQLAAADSDALQVSGCIASVFGSCVMHSDFKLCQQIHKSASDALEFLDALHQPSAQQKGFVGSSSHE